MPQLGVGSSIHFNVTVSIILTDEPGMLGPARIVLPTAKRFFALTFGMCQPCGALWWEATEEGMGQYAVRKCESVTARQLLQFLSTRSIAGKIPLA